MENLLIVTAQPEFLSAALDELKRLDRTGEKLIGAAQAPLHHAPT